MANRNERARIAAETVAIIQAGGYRAPSGMDVSIGDAVQLAVDQTRLITPGELPTVRSRARAVMERRAFSTSFDVRNETTFAAAGRLVERFGPDAVAALNFASARSPGGGFLSGSQAQEESLARASALYTCLQGQTGYYDANRNKRTETDAQNKTTTWEYDSGGNIKTVIDPLGRRVSYVNNEHGQTGRTVRDGFVPGLRRQRGHQRRGFTVPLGDPGPSTRATRAARPGSR